MAKQHLHIGARWENGELFFCTLSPEIDWRAVRLVTTGYEQNVEITRFVDGKAIEPKERADFGEAMPKLLYWLGGADYVK